VIDSVQKALKPRGAKTSSYVTVLSSEGK